MSLHDSLERMYEIQKVIADFRFRSDIKPDEVAGALLHYLRKLPNYDQVRAERLADAFDLDLALADARQVHNPNETKPTPSQLSNFELGFSGTPLPSQEQVHYFHCAKCSRDFRCTEAAFKNHDCAGRSSLPPNPASIPTPSSHPVSFAELDRVAEVVRAAQGDATPKAVTAEDVAIQEAAPEAFEALVDLRAKTTKLSEELATLAR